MASTLAIPGANATAICNYMAIQTPSWVKHAIFYQIFPDRFARGRSGRSTSLDGSVDLQPWDAPPTTQGYKGGNLWGVIDRLDYLEDLGITAIYLNPIFTAASNHRYNTDDYYQVDPLLGGDEAFEALVRAVRRRGMHLMLDGVFNHVGRGFFRFHDIVENGPHSPWLDWFDIHGWPIAPFVGDRPANYRTWVGHRSLPELNHDNPAVREYIMEVGEYWIGRGVDGWRLDVPNCVTADGFWQEFRDRVKARNPTAYIVGEVWGDARPWLDGTQFDGVMNYLFAGPTIAFAAGDRVNAKLAEGMDYSPAPALTAEQYATKMRELLSLYDWEIQQTQFNLLDSHDTARIKTLVGDDRDSVFLATLLLMTFPGAPCIYYGHEVGLAGGRDPDCRRAFPDRAQWDLEMLAFQKQLIALRKERQALRAGNYRILHARGNTYAFVRTLKEETIVVAANVGTEAATIEAELPDAPQHLLLGRGEITYRGNRLTIDIPARSGSILGSHL